MGLRLDVVCAHSYFVSSGRYNMSGCRLERHPLSDDLDLHGRGNSQVSGILVMTPFLGATAETCASSSTCKSVASTPNALAISIVEDYLAIIEKRQLRQLLLLETSFCSYKPPRPGISTA